VRRLLVRKRRRRQKVRSFTEQKIQGQNQPVFSPSGGRND
jgi:hypothetical protein